MKIKIQTENVLLFDLIFRSQVHCLFPYCNMDTNIKCKGFRVKMITFSLFILNGRLYVGEYHFISCPVFQEKWTIEVFIELSILGLTNLLFQDGTENLE